MSAKFGGDVYQGNKAGQANVSGQEIKGVSNSGNAILDSFGGYSFNLQHGTQDVSQDMSQDNKGLAGDGGFDNMHADTKIGFLG